MNRRSGGEMLVKTFASRASAKQRQGRAGRIQPGICLKLFSSETERNVMKANTTPELQRVPLEDVCLTILSMGDYSVYDFLSSAPQPPAETAVSDAIKVLESVGCIEQEQKQTQTQTQTQHPQQHPQQKQKLTNLGKVLAVMPTQVKIAKIILFGILFGQAEAVLDLACCLTSGKPLFFTNEHVEGVRALLKMSEVGKRSDFVALGKLYRYICDMKELKGERAVKEWCEKNGISYRSFFEAAESRASLRNNLVDRGVMKRGVELESSNSNSNINSNSNTDDEIISFAIVAALMPDIAECDLTTGDIFCKSNERVFMNKESVNSKALAKNSRSGGVKHLVFYEKFSTSANRTWLSHSQIVTPMQMLMFSKQLELNVEANESVVEGFVKVAKKSKVVAEVRKFKEELAGVLERCFEAESGGGELGVKESNFLRRRLANVLKYG